MIPRDDIVCEREREADEKEREEKKSAGIRNFDGEYETRVVLSLESVVTRVTYVVEEILSRNRLIKKIVATTFVLPRRKLVERFSRIILIITNDFPRKIRPTRRDI